MDTIVSGHLDSDCEDVVDSLPKVFSANESTLDCHVKQQKRIVPGVKNRNGVDEAFIYPGKTECSFLGSDIFRSVQ